MTSNLANIDETKRAMEYIRLDIENLTRIQNQLKIHYDNLMKS